MDTRIIYPYDTSEAVQVFNVNAQETVTYVLPAPGLGKSDDVEVTYSILDSRGREVPKEDWLSYGGWVGITRHPDRQEVRLMLKGPTGIGPSFSLATLDVHGFRRNSLQIWALVSEPALKVFRKSDSKSRVVLDRPNTNYELTRLDHGQILLTPA